MTSSPSLLKNAQVFSAAFIFSVATSMAAFAQTAPSDPVTAAPATTPAPAKTEEQPQIKLTAQIIQNFVATYKDMKLTQKAVDNTAGKKAVTADEEGGDAVSTVRTPEAQAKMLATLKKHGFESLDQWSQTVQTVMLAYGYADPESGMMDMETNISQSIEETKKNEDLSEEDRKKAIENLQEEYKKVEFMKPLPGNVEAVKPFVTAIRNVVESE